MAAASMTEPGRPTSVRDALQELTRAIDAAGVGDSPRLDAELLLCAVTRLDRVGLRVHSDRPLTAEAWRQLDRLVERRCGGEPVAYLLGTAWFHGREFLVDARVLVPRPETELLVEVALEHLAGWPGGGRAVLVDACTGSGCVAVTLAAELGAEVEVHATDVDAGALEVAAANVARHAVAVHLHQGDLLEPLAGALDDAVAAIVANPPYVAGPHEPGLEAGVRDHEPHVALFVPDGDVVGLYARLARQAVRLLAPGALLAVEHGQGQGAAVAAALGEAGLVDVSVIPDLAGIDRAVVGYRAGGGRPCS